MYGLLVTNDSLKTEKYLELNAKFSSAAERLGVRLDKKTNAEIGDVNSLPKYDFVLFWDKDSRIALKMEQSGFKLFNSLNAITICDDKWLTYVMLEKNNIPTPKSIIAPLVFKQYDWNTSPFISKVESLFSYPIIAKHCFGSFGEQVYLLYNRKSMIDFLVAAKGEPVLFQKFISESCGKDLRIEVIGGKYVAAMLRQNTNDFRANLTIGGLMHKYIPTKEEIDIAEKTAKCLGLDFCGVDILFSNNGPMVCEVNSNAHFANLQKCTNIDAAELIIKHVINEVGKKQ